MIIFANKTTGRYNKDGKPGMLSNLRKIKNTMLSTITSKSDSFFLLFIIYYNHHLSQYFSS